MRLVFQAFKPQGPDTRLSNIRTHLNKRLKRENYEYEEISYSRSTGIDDVCPSNGTGS